MADNITVLKNNVPTGPFTRAQIAGKIQAGEVSLEDLAFVEGLSQWTPLRDVLAKMDEVLLPSVPVPPAAPSVPPPYSYAATMQPPGHLIYGGFWMRFVAYFIDSLILTIPVMILLMLIGGVVGGIAAVHGGMAHSSGDSNSDPMNNPLLAGGIIVLELVIWASFLVIAWLYFAKLESGPAQATYGKRAMGLKVTNVAGERLSFAHASGRFFSKLVSGLIPFAIGYIIAAFTERKQALHDIIASTLVVKK